MSQAKEQLFGKPRNTALIVGISSTKRWSSGTVELNVGWKIFYSNVDAAMSA